MKRTILFCFLILTFGKSLIGQNVGIGTDSPLGELHVTKLAPEVTINFTGSGLNDLSVDQSGFTSDNPVTYFVKVENAGPDPNLFQWSNNGVDFSGNVAMSTIPVTLNNGVTISFANTFGHTYGDVWTFEVHPAFPDGLVVTDGNVGIGTSTPQTKLDVNGPILIGDYDGDSHPGMIRYNPNEKRFYGYAPPYWKDLSYEPSQKNIYIPAIAFSENSTNGNSQLEHLTIGGNIHFDSRRSDRPLIYPIVLPVGSVISSVAIYYYDYSTGSTTTYLVEGELGSNNTVLHTIFTSEGASDFVRVSNNNDLDVLISNSKSYWMQFSTSTYSPLLGLKGVKIFYNSN